MKRFVKTHKKQCIWGVSIFLLVLFVILVWLLIVPAFKNNKYGDRLKDIDKHKIATSTIDKIKGDLSDNESVTKVSYHNEGRILNFTIIVNSMSKDDAKKLGEVILSNLDKSDVNYYDIQILIDSKEKSNDFPMIGYKSKSTTSFNFGNGVGKSE